MGSRAVRVSKIVESRVMHESLTSPVTCPLSHIFSLHLSDSAG